MTASSPPACGRFEDRLLDAFLERLENIRGDSGPLADIVPAPTPHRGPIAPTFLAALAVAGLAAALTLQFAPGPAGTAPGPRWTLAGYVVSPWEHVAGRGLAVSGPDHQALTCPSVTTCYVEGPAEAGRGTEVEATYDTGRTWQLAGLKGASALSNVSCSSPRDCAVLEVRVDNEPLFVETTDGGTTWLAHPAPSFLSASPLDATSDGASPGQTEVMTVMSCRGASSCGVLAWSGTAQSYKPSGRGTASVTSDGGRTWSSPVPAFRASWELRCLAGGKCLAAGPWGAAYSTDSGLRWTISAGWPTGAASYFSCATQARCTALSLSPGAGAESLLVSSDAGESWSFLRGAKLPTGALYTSLACPTSSDCWVSGESIEGQSAGEGVVLSSADGGRTWGTSLLPQGTGIVYAVSCPEQSTCFAVAGTSPTASSPTASPPLVHLAHLEDDSRDAAS